MNSSCVKTTQISLYQKAHNDLTSVFGQLGIELSRYFFRSLGMFQTLLFLKCYT